MHPEFEKPTVATPPTTLFVRLVDCQRMLSTVAEGVVRVWPSAELEKEMIADADLLAGEFELTSAGNDAACHVKALLVRVRELEQLEQKADFIRGAMAVLLEEYAKSLANARAEISRERALTGT